MQRGTHPTPPHLTSANPHPSPLTPSTPPTPRGEAALQDTPTHVLAWCLVMFPLVCHSVAIWMEVVHPDLNGPHRNHGEGAHLQRAASAVTSSVSTALAASAPLEAERPPARAPVRNLPDVLGYSIVEPVVASRRPQSSTSRITSKAIA